ncbi:MAG: transposase [Rectinemataceae bacterium]
MSWYYIYFKLYPGTIKQEQVIDFLRHFLRLLHGNVLVIWDGLRSHHGSLAKKFVKDRNGRLEIFFLPAYAPELNPVEYLWGYWKMRDLPNFCAADYQELSSTALSALKTARGSDEGDPHWKQPFGNKLNSPYELIFMQGSVSRTTV